MKKNYARIFTIAIIVLCSGTSAMADVSDAFSNVYVAMFGKQSSHILPTSALDCTTMENGSGWLQRVNILLCEMKYAMGINGVGSATQTVGTGGGAVTFHGEISAGCTGGNVSGGTTAYAYAYSVWVCAGDATVCTTTTQFSRIVSLCSNFTDDGTGLDGLVNQGELMLDPSIPDGLSAGSEALYAVYDLGSTAAAQKAIIQQVDTGVYAVRGDVSRTDKNHIGFAVALNAIGGGSPTTSLRFAGTINRLDNTATGYVEQAGSTGSGTTTTVDLTDAGDTAGGGACLSRSASAGDWLYVVTSSGPSCVPSMPNALDSVNTIGAYTVSGLVGTWHSMAANPSGL